MIHSPELNLLLFRNRSPYLSSAKGTGTNATATNPSSDVAQPTPRASYICITNSGKANAARYRMNVQEDHAEALYKAP